MGVMGLIAFTVACEAEDGGAPGFLDASFVPDAGPGWGGLSDAGAGFDAAPTVPASDAFVPTPPVDGGLDSATGAGDATADTGGGQPGASLDASVDDGGDVDAGEPDPGPQPAAGAVLCAYEGQTCQLPTGVIATVWYGTGDSWAVATEQQGAVGCDNATFGDPASGFGKECRYTQTGGAPAQCPARFMAGGRCYEPYFVGLAPSDAQVDLVHEMGHCFFHDDIYSNQKYPNNDGLQNESVMFSAPQIGDFDRVVQRMVWETQR